MFKLPVRTEEPAKAEAQELRAILEQVLEEGLIVPTDVRMVWANDDAWKPVMERAF
jgi:hypothetical protein